MIGYEDPMFTELMRMYFTIHRSVTSSPLRLWLRLTYKVPAKYLVMFNIGFANQQLMSDSKDLCRLIFLEQLFHALWKPCKHALFYSVMKHF
jgi:hypothetical protein